MISAIDKTLKTCLYADVIEMIFFTSVQGSRWMTCTDESAGKI